MRDAIDVRLLVVDDVSHIVQLQHRAYASNYLEDADSFLAKITASPLTAFGAWHNNQLVGYLVAVLMHDHEGLDLNTSYIPAVPMAEAQRVYIHDLAVHPDFRGTGLADTLLECLDAAVTSAPIVEYLLVSVQGSHGFWEKRGFVVSSDPVPNGYGPEAVLMLRR